MTHVPSLEQIRDKANVADWVVSAVVNGVRFYLNEAGTATDIPDRAKRFWNAVAATTAARQARLEAAWAGFSWMPQNLNYVLAGAGDAPQLRNNRE